MTRLAFYAPMKPPCHPTPSGDRAMARALMQALKLGGARVDLASDLRIYDGHGDTAIQDRLAAAARQEVARLSAEGRVAGWQAWISYHNYYKAPDLVGPPVARALNIPYLLVEATRAGKRLGGPWDRFARAAEDACDAARAICYVTQHDAVALRDRAPDGQELVHLRPFLPRADLPAASDGSGPMLSVGMMRSADKLASYRLIADTLALLDNRDWRLDIAGGGQHRAAVEDMMAPFGARVRLLGVLDADALQARYRHARLLLWPGVNEAFGLSYLEAQAHGLPVVAQDRPGVRDVLAPAAHPTPAAGAPALAARIAALLDRPADRAAEADAARDHVAKHHLMPAASWTLHQCLRRVLA